MLLYRAINDREYQNIVIYGRSITALDGLSVDRGKELYTYYASNNKSRSYNFILSHVDGKWVKSKSVSPWISMSKDFHYTVENYSNVRANNDFFFDSRRCIIVMNADNLSRTSEEIEENNKKHPFIVDLSDDNLSNLVIDGTIGLQEYSKYAPDYKINNHVYNYLIKKPRALRSYSEKATLASEVLVFGKLDIKNVDAVLYPIMIDLLYSYNIDINNDFHKFKINLDKAYKMLTALYTASDFPSLYSELHPDVFSGSDLTTYLVNHYDEINGNTIEDKYESLKEEKRKLLQKIASILFPNKIFSKPSRLTDDNISVYSYDRLVSMMEDNRFKRNQYSVFDGILLIERDGKIYQYNSEYNLYESSKGYIDKRLIKR